MLYWIFGGLFVASGDKDESRRAIRAGAWAFVILFFGSVLFFVVWGFLQPSPYASCGHDIVRADHTEYCSNPNWDNP